MLIDGIKDDRGVLHVTNSQVYTLAPKYLYRDYLKAKVYTIWVHGLLNHEP